MSADVSTWVATAASWIGVVISWWFARKSQHAQTDAAASAAAARKEDHTAKTRELFTAICSLPTVDSKGSHHGEAYEKAGALYAHLGNDARARYVVSTAVAFFVYGRNTSNRVQMDELEEERKKVEGHLADLSQLKIPAAGAVRFWAKRTGPDDHRGPWLLRETD
ncbi:MAG TPA: hypothetical protein VGG39_02685 [Polyangiaceae bacterium]|jgi:hypothetical protein